MCQDERHSAASMVISDPTDPAVGRYRLAAARLDDLIAPSSPADGSLAAVQARAADRLDRTRRFLAHLGDPQDVAPIVHVGGTSGKGSTAAIVAAILGASGYRVGLHTSPYLQVATEKLQIDGRLIAPDDFADLVDDTLAAMDGWVATGDGESLTYGEIWTVLAARWLAAERVDLAVVEVGAGGRFDPTNVVRPTVSVITGVGLDHTASLGETISEIAWHKAGIIKPGAPVVTGATDPAALGPIAAEAAAAGVPLVRVAEGVTFEVLASDPDGARWREIDAVGRASGPIYGTSSPGRFQAANAALAVAAVRALAPSGFDVPTAAVAAGLAAARLPGRMEEMPRSTGPRVLLDGAHNPDKAAALATDLPGRPPGAGPLVLVVGVLEGKGSAAMLARLAPRADALVLTAPRVTGKTAEAPAALAAAARAGGFAGPIRIEPEPNVALDLAVALTGSDGAVVVTGSLYLVGNVRGRWYPSDDVLRYRTPWPPNRHPGRREAG